MGPHVLVDPLEYPGYTDQLERAAKRSGSDESVKWSINDVAGTRCVSVSFVYSFMGGTLGEESGSRVVRAIDCATADRLPLVTRIRTGGARVQEGIRALMQMQSITRALGRLKKAGLPHISVVCEPTTGGVWASLGASADVIIAIEGATVAFAGPRVRAHPEYDPAFFAEGKLQHGFVDVLVPPQDVDDTVARYLRVFATRSPDPLAPCDVPAALGTATAKTGWESVLNARAAGRPKVDAYLDSYFDERVLIDGDRVGGRDPAMRCGIGLRQGKPVAFAGQAGAANSAAGFRTVIRLLAIAGDLRLPVLTLVDTPGAANDAQAERDGIGTAIQQTFAAMNATTSPVTTLVIGEGGSGGALALCASGNIWITPDAYFSVISPEGAAAILHRDGEQAQKVADRLRITPRDAVELGLANGIVTR